VDVAAVGSVLPLDHDFRGRAFAFGDGPPLPVGQRPDSRSISVSPDYFKATGTRVLRGSGFTDADNATGAPVAIVNAEFARKFLDGDAVGRRFRINLHGHDIFTPITTVGVVEDVHLDSLESEITPIIYLPYEQVPESDAKIVLRTGGAAASLTGSMRKAVSDTDAAQPLFDVVTMESLVSQSLAMRRLIMLLIAAFAVLAMMLAGVGVYGVFSYWVSQRRKEMAIRLALGSSRSELLRLIVSQAMFLILAGGLMGIAGAWVLDRLLVTMLVGVHVHDPVSLVLAGGLMTLVAVVGSCVPARNASYTNVIAFLHSE
jgi:ABC-type antimicrobial peptide transport system permease subunit